MSCSELVTMLRTCSYTAMTCFELAALTGGVADLPSVPFEVQVGVELALCGRGRQLRSTAMVVAHKRR